MSERIFETDIAVVGAGPAGLAAASVAAENGRRVILVDDTPWLGGQIWRGQQANASLPQAQIWFERVRRSGAVLLNRTSVIAAPEAGLLLAEHDQGPRQIRWHKLILATGARELFLPFPGWILPGVVGPGGLLALTKNGWPVKDQRVVVAGGGPLLFAAAHGLRKLGARLVSIAEQAPRWKVNRFAVHLYAWPGKLWQAVVLKTGLLNVPYRCGVWPLNAEGDDRLRRVTLTDGERSWTEACDFLACGFGLTPNIELPLLLSCELREGSVRVDEWQQTSVSNVFCAGESTGIGGADCALIEGQIAGHAASGELSKARSFFAARAAWHRFRAHLADSFALRPELKALAANETILCRCEDITLGHVRRFKGWREAKLHSRCGMGPCQARVCGTAAKFIFGWNIESVRPPIMPARVGSLITSPSEGSGETKLY